MADVTPHEAALAKINDMWTEPEAETQEVAPETEAETAEVDPQEAEAGATPPQPEEVEVEIEGETYLIPKKISDKFIQHADYTRKTQDIAELRRALTSATEAQAIERAFTQSVSEEQKQLTLLDAQIAQFKQLDWSKVEDTSQLLHLRTQLDQLKDSRADVDQSIKAKRSEFEGKIKEASNEAINAGKKYIEQNIKGFNESMKQGLFAYGLNEGYSRDELDRIVDPRIVVTLWKAHQWDSLKASQPNVTNRAAKASPVIKPGATKQTPSRVQQLNRQFKEASGRANKTRAAEAYFAEIFSGSNGSSGKG